MMLKFNDDHSFNVLSCDTFVRAPVPCEVMWGQSLSWATGKQQCASKFSSNAGKVQRLPWQAGKNIGKMNCEHGNCSSLSCSKRPGQFEPGLVEQGGRGLWVAHGGDEGGRIICCQLKRQQGSCTSFFFKKVFFPPRDRALWDNH